MKKCSRCSTAKILNEFTKDRKTASGLNAYCRLCRKIEAKAYRQNNKVKIAKGLRKIHLRKKFGLSESDYTKILMEQGCRCAICLKMNTSGKHFDVDHDHKTGKVRGLLCNGCNRGIGRLKDNPRIIKAALSYVQCGGRS